MEAYFFKRQKCKVSRTPSPINFLLNSHFDHPFWQFPAYIGYFYEKYYQNSMRFAFITAILLTNSLFAQETQPISSSEILLQLQKLNTVGSVLYIAAHPDDENTRLLGYLATDRKLRTGYLSLTRGDGGQNLIGNELGEGLGVIRTQELLAARRIDGAEQFFTRANDFGYSKNPEETFTIWEKDQILADVVLTIRKFKPDVIICRFPTTGEGGHGHHTASAILAMEAFDLAGDPTKYPEQLDRVSVWQPKRIFWNTFNFGGRNTTSPDQLTINVGTYNPLTGESYGEVAANSRSMHKSQGFGSTKQRGENIEYFKLLKGEEAEKDPFEGIDQSWKRIPQATFIQGIISETIEQFQVQHPEKSLKQLTLLYQALKEIDSKDPTINYWKNVKLKECEALILACGGIWLESTNNDFSVVPGSELSLNTQLIARNPANIRLKAIHYLNQDDTIINSTLETNQLMIFKFQQTLSTSTPYSGPYWLNETHSVGMYTVNDAALIGQAENNPALSVVFDLEIEGVPIQISRGVFYKHTDPVKGEVYRPLEILPVATVEISDPVFVFSEVMSKEITCVVKANEDNVKGQLELTAPKGWKLEIPDASFLLTKKGEEKTIVARLTSTSKSEDGELKAALNINNQSLSYSIQRIEYDHIPYQFILREPSAKVVFLDLKTTGKNIGYIPGAGDNVAASLKQIGYRVTELTDELINTSELSQFDCIITGIRAFNVNERLPLYHSKLMEYVKNGGNMIVQYNTNNRNAAIETQIGPYPFTISRDRVTVDDAEVTFTNPTHPAMTTPNKITQDDFKNWIQERGIYFASEVDTHYETLFSMHDPGEDPKTGSLIIGKYGKGNFVYTGLVFFRELPAGIPGAYRLFVNLISLPKNL